MFHFILSLKALCEVWWKIHIYHCEAFVFWIFWCFYLPAFFKLKAWCTLVGIHLICMSCDWFITSIPLNWKVALDARINLACSWCLPDFYKAKLLLFGAVQAWSELPHTCFCRPIHHTCETWLVKFRLCTHYFSCKNNALFFFFWSAWVP